MKLNDFAEAISTRVWESVGQANWRKFEDARVFVRNLGLKSEAEWRRYFKSGAKPSDIPYTPNVVYANDGWSGMGDWLGTGTVATHLRQYRPFREARAFVRTLGLKSQVEWLDYCRSGEKPGDIPSTPIKAYADAGWVGMSDWLGNGGRIAQDQYRPFKDARAFVRKLGLKSQAEWAKYNKSGKKPANIPAKPSGVYADAGWVGMGDWLGTGTIAPQLRKYPSFEKARAFVRSLKLKSGTEWRQYCKSGTKPADIPDQANRKYSGAGWTGMGDWLGTGNVATYLRKYRTFKDARAFVRKLGLASQAEWREYNKSGKRPTDIPASPDHGYANQDWVGWPDWLGYSVLRKS